MASRFVSAIIAALLIAASAQADEAMSVRRGLETVPLAGWNGVPPLITVVDLSAARAAIGKDDPWWPASRFANDQIRPLRAWRVGDPAQRDRLTGGPVASIAGFVGYGAPPNDVSIWVMKDDARATSLFDTLPGRGFAPRGDGLLANGEPNHVDIQRRAPDDPWLGDLGLTSVVARQGRILLQGRNDAAVTVARQAADANIIQAPVVDAVLRGLEAATADGALVVQADLVSQPIDDHGNLLSPSIEQALDDVPGLPPYWAVLDARVERAAGTQGRVTAYGFTDCAAAAEAARRLARSWDVFRTRPGSVKQVEGVDVSTQTVAGARGACSAVLAVTAPSPDADFRVSFAAYGLFALLLSDAPTDAPGKP